jgi:hypothetical protein
LPLSCTNGARLKNKKKKTLKNQQYNSASAESMFFLDQPKPNYLKCNVDFTLFHISSSLVKLDLEPLSKTIKSVFPMAQTAWSTNMMEQHEGEAASLLSALNRTAKVSWIKLSEIRLTCQSLV